MGDDDAKFLCIRGGGCTVTDNCREREKCADIRGWIDADVPRLNYEEIKEVFKFECSLSVTVL